MSAAPHLDVMPRTGTARLVVDPAAVTANARLLAGRARRDLMAVVKADGFGHGAATVARAALAGGATSLGVTALPEAFALRDAGIDAPVLSWLNPVDADWRAAVAAEVEVAVPSLAHLRAVADAGRGAAGGVRCARVHLQVDAGLARDGAEPATWGALFRAARAEERRGRLRVVGLMGHLPCADEPAHPANRMARTRFAHALQGARVAGLRPVHRHLAATAATLTDPLSHHTLVRVGAGLVGIDPSGTTDLRWAMTLTAPVVEVRRVPAGTPVGYGHTWTAPRATTLALLPLGYADGLPRVASGRAEVLLAGRRRPLVGRVSMDQVVVDVGDDGVAPGDVATLIGPGDAGEPTPADWAAWCDTLPHEIVTGLGHRIVRSTAPVLRPVGSPA